MADSGVQIDIYGPTSKISGNFPKAAVRLVTSYPVEGAQFAQSFRKGMWDGRKHLFRLTTSTFPTGLLHLVKEACELAGEVVTVVDHRTPRTPQGGSYDLIGVSMTGKYDYQLEAARTAVEAKQGVIRIATGGGKTEISCSIVNYLKLPTVFMVTTRELLYQARDRFMLRLGATEAEVGIIGDGHWQPGSWVTIATIATLESRLEKQECQDFLQTIEVMFVDECVEEHSVISTETGYAYAKNVKVGMRVATDRGYQPVVRVKHQIKPGVEIVADGGVRLACSTNHPIAVLRDNKITYIHADAVLVGDTVLERLVGKNTNDVFDARAYIAGVFAGDGHWHSPKKVRWAYRKDFDYWEKTFYGVVQAAYADAVLRISINARGDHTLTVDSPELLQDLSALGFYCRENKHAHLPVHPSMASYIAGLYDTEGSIDPRTSRAGFQTTCKEVMQASQRFLRDAGIPASFISCIKKNEKHKTSYRVQVPSAYSTEFFSCCPSLMERKRLLKSRETWSGVTHIKDEESNTLARSVASRPLRVRSISSIGEIKTVEFEVETDHTFVANGLLTHNCHHMGSDTVFEVCALCPANYRYGLSGTPMDRTDGANLRLLGAVGGIIVDVSNKFLVDRGISAKAEIIFTKITAPVIPKKTAYATVYKQGVVDNPNLMGSIIEWVKIFHKQGIGTLVLCEEIAQGKAIDEALWTATDGQFIPHQFIYGDDDTDVRRNALKDFGEGKLPVLVASVILDEGIDCKNIDALILAGSRKSKIKTMQRLGRGLRGEKLIVVEFSNFCHDYLLRHSLQRYQDYKKEDCFPIHQSGPSVELVKKIWNAKG